MVDVRRDGPMILAEGIDTLPVFSVIFPVLTGELSIHPLTLKHGWGVELDENRCENAIRDEDEG